MIDVVALGELLIDFTCISSDLDGYPTMVAHPGGAPANFLATISRFGGKTALIGKVGTDAFGKKLINTLCKTGIDAKNIISSDSYFTTLAFVTLDNDGDREFSFARKPGADTQLRFEEIDLDVIRNCRVFHFGTLSLTDEPARETTYRVVEYARTLGKIISFDPNLRKPLWPSLAEARKQMLWGLEHADIVKISDEEVKFLFDLTPEQGANYLLERFDIKLVFVTCGADGCVFANKQCLDFVPALKGLKVIDTTGAGDVFGGSALWKLLQLNEPIDELSLASLKEISSFACVSAGLSTTKEGGITSIPSLNEICEVLS